MVYQHQVNFFIRAVNVSESTHQISNAFNKQVINFLLL